LCCSLANVCRHQLIDNYDNLPADSNGCTTLDFRTSNFWPTIASVVQSRLIYLWETTNDSAAKLLKRIRSDADCASYISLESRREVKLRALFRHNRLLTQHRLFVLNQQPTEACLSCGHNSETIVHLLRDCPAFMRERGRCQLALLMLNADDDSTIDCPYSLAFLLGEVPTSLNAEDKSKLLAISARLILSIVTTRPALVP
jgi:hypothetical protein